MAQRPNSPFPDLEASRTYTPHWHDLAMLAEISCNNSVLEFAHDAVRQSRRSFSRFLCQGIVDRYCDLVCNKGQEALLFRRIRVVEMAGKCELPNRRWAVLSGRVQDELET